MSISNRVFGEDIPVIIKKKLEARQKIALQTQTPNTQIKPSAYPDDLPNYYTFGAKQGLLNLNFEGEADLSSRTPFARMWTAVEIRRYDMKNPVRRYGLDEGDEARKFAKDKTAIKSHGPMRVEYIRGKGFHVLKSAPIHTKVYTMGSHTLSQFSEPNQPLDDRTKGTLTNEQRQAFTPEVFETNQNEFMRPPAGITSVSSATETALGAIKKTTINFSVHNYHDFERIYSQYFLRHGATVFLDFGWDTTNQKLYDPNNLLKEGRMQDVSQYLYGALDGSKRGWVEKSNGDMDTIVGYVTSFDVKLTPNGGFECSVELTSKNEALVSKDMGDDIRARMKKQLDIEILRYAVGGFKEAGDDTATELYEKSRTWGKNAESLEDWEKIFYLFAEENLRDADVQSVPNQTHTQLGVFYGMEGNAKSIFIAWSLFEDLILNSEFGFIDTTQKKQMTPNDLGIKPYFNSGGCFMRWDENLFKYQRYRSDITGASILYPQKWSLGMTLNQYKSPKQVWAYRIPDGGGDPVYLMDGENWKDFTKWDKERGQIPMREVFVNVEIIKEALDQAKDVGGMMKFVLNAINDDMDGLVNLQLSSGGVNNKMSVSDANLLQLEKPEKSSWFDKLFTFKPMEPGTLIKSFDISISPPEGGLQNIIAIQSTGGQSNAFPATDVVDKQIALSLLDDINPDETDPSTRLVLQYVPSDGDFRAEKLDQDQTYTQMNFADRSRVFEGNNFISSLKANKPVDEDKWAELLSAADEDNLIIDDSDPDDYKVEKDKNAEQSKIEDADERAAKNRLLGKTVVDTIGDFYLHLAKSHLFGQQIQTLLPINVSLDIYGISNLVPGDLCRVDYLPKKYRDRTFFQVTRVAQELNSGTWTTKLDMVMRFWNKLKFESHKKKSSAEIILNVNALTKYRLAHWDKINRLPKYIRDLKPVDTMNMGFNHIDSVLSFKTHSIKNYLIVPIPTNDYDKNTGNWSGYGAAYHIHSGTPGNWWGSIHGKNLPKKLKQKEFPHAANDNNPSYKLLSSKSDITYYLVISNSGEEDQRWWCITTIPPGESKFKQLYDWDCDNITKKLKKKIPKFK